jgi:hypothetical protein
MSRIVIVIPLTLLLIVIYLIGIYFTLLFIGGSSAMILWQKSKKTRIKIHFSAANLHEGRDMQRVKIAVTVHITLQGRRTNTSWRPQRKDRMNSGHPSYIQTCNFTGRQLLMVVMMMVMVMMRISVLVVGGRRHYRRCRKWSESGWWLLHIFTTILKMVMMSHYHLYR